MQIDLTFFQHTTQQRENAEKIFENECVRIPTFMLLVTFLCGWLENEIQRQNKEKTGKGRTSANNIFGNNAQHNSV